MGDFLCIWRGDVPNQILDNCLRWLGFVYNVLFGFF